jgi:hypothetical protein
MRLVAFEVASRPGYAVLVRPEYSVLPSPPIRSGKQALSGYCAIVREPSDWEETESLPAGSRKLITTKNKPRLEAEDEARIKPCPFCGKRTFLVDGCNYMKCSDSDPPSSCPGQWCFQDGLPKYRPIPGKEYLGCCNDKSHNSH